MTGAVRTAGQATDIALDFIRKHRLFSPALALRAVREGGTWLVEVDVGLIAVKLAKVKIDGNTGDILEYDIPA